MTGGMGFVQPIDKPVHRLDEKGRNGMQVRKAGPGASSLRSLSIAWISFVVFHSLKREELDEVLEIELGQVQKRRAGFDDTPSSGFGVISKGREFPAARGGPTRGMERVHLKRAIERYLLGPLARAAGHGASAFG